MQTKFRRRAVLERPSPALDRLRLLCVMLLSLRTRVLRAVLSREVLGTPTEPEHHKTQPGNAHNLRKIGARCVCAAPCTAQESATNIPQCFQAKATLILSLLLGNCTSPRLRVVQPEGGTLHPSSTALWPVSGLARRLHAAPALVSNPTHCVQSSSRTHTPPPAHPNSLQLFGLLWMHGPGVVSGGCAFLQADSLETRA